MPAISSEQRSANGSTRAHSRPLVVFDDRLYILYSSIVPENTVRYLSSSDGVEWTVERNLPVATDLDSQGSAGTWGGVGAARHFDQLVVAWVSDAKSSDPDIYASVYRSS